MMHNPKREINKRITGAFVAPCNLSPNSCKIQKAKIEKLLNLGLSRKRWQKSGKNRNKPLFMFPVNSYNYLYLNILRP